MTSESSNLQNIYLASSRRPLQLRMRADLVCKRQNYMGRRYWVVKDPLTLDYFRFEEEEFFLLESLNGNHSLEQLRDLFEDRFAPQRITFSELHRFLGTVHRSCLAVSSAPDQGAALDARSREKRRKKSIQAITNVLSFRTRGIDPDRMLTSLYRGVGFFFSLPALIFVLALGLSALLLLGTHYDTFSRRLPHFNEFFAMENWMWLAGTLAITKVLHEFGHGLACKRFGGECHEMGIMLLVFTPCLYCNVSDSWMLNNRWHRAAIAAAGMYVEFFLAAVATWVWWYSVPGVVHYLALNVMFVCSVSTLLFNANPLMRYDGYYILSDLAEIPNLRQKASKILQNWASQWCLGIEPAEDPFLPHRNRFLFAIYSVAAVIYRWVITFSILWFVNAMLEPYGLQFIASLIAAMSIFGLVVFPLWKLSRFLLEGIKMRRIKATRLTMTSLVIGGACLLLFIPIPYFVQCGVKIELRGDEPVYVEVAGTLGDLLVEQGAKMKAGESIARLENSTIELALIDLVARETQLKEVLETLSIRALEDQVSASRLAEVRTELSNVLDQKDQRLTEQNNLVLESPCDGVLFPVAFRPAASDRSVLPQWSGQPLATRNLGAYFSKGVRVGTVGNPKNLQAILSIDQSDIPFIAAGQDVEIILHQHPTKLFNTKIGVLGRRKSQEPAAGQPGKNGSTVADEQNSAGGPATLYFASAPLDVTDFVAPAGTGTARVAVGKRSLFSRLSRTISRTFRFEM